MMKQKKGQIQISFNWIFVLIVGSVFLIFFFSLITKQSESSDREIATVVGKQFSTVLTVASQDSGTFKTHDTSYTEVDFECDSKENVYRYELSGKQTPIKPDLIFAPRRIETNRFYTWTQSWKAPYDAATFTFLTTREHAFLFANVTSSTMDELLIPFPENLTRYEFDPENVPRRIQYDKYTYVLFAEQLDAFSTMRGEDVFIKDKNTHILIIEPEIDSLPFSYGRLYFLSYDDVSGDFQTIQDYLLLGAESRPYMGKASIYGAMFVDDQDFYACTMDKAFERLRIMTLLNYYRVDTQKSIVAADSSCQTLLQGVLPGSGLNDTLYQFNQALQDKFSDLVFLEVKNLYEDYIFVIEQKNRRLSFESQCPLIY